LTVAIAPQRSRTTTDRIEIGVRSPVFDASDPRGTTAAGAVVATDKPPRTGGRKVPNRIIERGGEAPCHFGNEDRHNAPCAPHQCQPIASRRVPAVTVAGLATTSLVMSWLTMSYARRIVISMDAARTRTVAYLRVSTDKQADRGVSLEAQRAKVESYAALYDLTLVAIEVDAGESAKSLARPALERTLSMLKAGKADALLVVKLDRLTRSVRDLCDLVDRYFRDGRRALLSVSEQVDTRSAAGRMVLNVLSSVSQWEREAIGERTAAAMQHKQAAGEYIGGAAPYGYQLAADGARLAPIAAEQAVITEARKLRAAGLSLRKVAEALDARGLRARNGRRFAPAQVARLVAA
jgi:site-specific DNA recombinase